MEWLTGCPGHGHCESCVTLSFLPSRLRTFQGHGLAVIADFMGETGALCITSLPVGHRLLLRAPGTPFSEALGEADSPNSVIFCAP